MNGPGGEENVAYVLQNAPESSIRSQSWDFLLQWIWLGISLIGSLNRLNKLEKQDATIPHWVASWSTRKNVKLLESKNVSFFCFFNTVLDWTNVIFLLRLLMNLKKAERIAEFCGNLCVVVSNSYFVCKWPCSCTGVHQSGSLSQRIYRQVRYFVIHFVDKGTTIVFARKVINSNSGKPLRLHAHIRGGIP